MNDYLIFGVLIILWVIGASLITYSIDQKYFKNKKKSNRKLFTGFTFVLSAGVVGVVLMIATLMIFGR